tara:strand:- start:556 stop:864 length:309 start_codon:yes stop_codon:yes gene_type:complete
MKRAILFSVSMFLGIAAFAAFPVETQAILTDPENERFKLDITAFIIGVLTFWMFLFFGLPLLLLFINKKNFRGSLALGWLAGLLLPLLIMIIIAAEDFSLPY